MHTLQKLSALEEKVRHLLNDYPPNVYKETLCFLHLSYVEQCIEQTQAAIAHLETEQKRLQQDVANLQRELAADEDRNDPLYYAKSVEQHRLDWQQKRSRLTLDQTTQQDGDCLAGHVDAWLQEQFSTKNNLRLTVLLSSCISYTAADILQTADFHPSLIRNLKIALYDASRRSSSNRFTAWWHYFFYYRPIIKKFIAFAKRKDIQKIITTLRADSILVRSRQDHEKHTEQASIATQRLRERKADCGSRLNEVTNQRARFGALNRQLYDLKFWVNTYHNYPRRPLPPLEKVTDSNFHDQQLRQFCNLLLIQLNEYLETRSKEKSVKFFKKAEKNYQAKVTTTENLTQALNKADSWRQVAEAINAHIPFEAARYSLFGNSAHLGRFNKILRNSFVNARERASQEQAPQLAARMRAGVSSAELLPQEGSGAVSAH